MKNFKQYLSEERFQYNPETFKYDPTDMAEIAKDREHAANWGYVQSPHGHYQHFTGKGEVFTPEYVRMWRLRGTHMESDPSNPYLPYKPNFSGYGENFGAEGPGQKLTTEKKPQEEEEVEKPIDASDHPMTFQEIGDKMGLTRSRIDQIHKRALAKLAQGLLGQNFKPSDYSRNIPNPSEEDIERINNSRVLNPKNSDRSDRHKRNK